MPEQDNQNNTKERQAAVKEVERLLLLFKEHYDPHQSVIDLARRLMAEEGVIRTINPDGAVIYISSRPLDPDLD